MGYMFAGAAIMLIGILIGWALGTPNEVTHIHRREEDELS